MLSNMFSACMGRSAYHEQTAVVDAEESAAPAATTTTEKEDEVSVVQEEKTKPKKEPKSWFWTEKQKVQHCQETYNLTDEDVEAYRKSFKQLDKDDNGTLDTSELGDAMHFWGESPTTGEIKALISKFDANKNGAMDFSEFLNLMMYRKKETAYEKEFLTIFTKYDTNKSGFLPIDDIQKVMSEKGIRDLSEGEIKSITDMVEKDPIGNLNYKQWVKVLIKKEYVSL